MIRREPTLTRKNKTPSDTFELEAKPTKKSSSTVFLKTLRRTFNFIIFLFLAAIATAIVKATFPTKEQKTETVISSSNPKPTLQKQTEHNTPSDPVRTIMHGILQMYEGKLPMRIGEITSLISVEASGNNFHQLFKIDIDSTTVDPVTLFTAASSQSKTFCNIKNAKQLLLLGIKVESTFIDTNELVIADITTDIETCGF